MLVYDRELIEMNQQGCDRLDNICCMGMKNIKYICKMLYICAYFSYAPYDRINPPYLFLSIPSGHLLSKWSPYIFYYKFLLLKTLVFWKILHKYTKKKIIKTMTNLELQHICGKCLKISRWIFIRVAATQSVSGLNIIMIKNTAL